jgi:hypothetical protein
MLYIAILTKELLEPLSNVVVTKQEGSYDGMC